MRRLRRDAQSRSRGGRQTLAGFDTVGLVQMRRTDRSGEVGVAVAVDRNGADALEELLPLLRRELRQRGAVALHGNRHTDFVAAVCAAHLHQARGVDPAEGLAAAARAGLAVTPEAAQLVGVEWEQVAEPAVAASG